MTVRMGIRFCHDLRKNEVSETTPLKKQGQERHRVERRTKKNLKGRRMYMADLFMRVEEVAEVMGVSVSYAYKVIRQFNKELKKTGCLTMKGRIDRKFFYENFYSTREENERK
jgi:hypothetical protein